MIRMFLRHVVSDVDAWKEAYDAFDAERKEMGVHDQAVFRTVDDPNEVTVWHDFETVDGARAFAGSDRLAEVMRAAGVAGEPVIWFTAPV